MLTRVFSHSGVSAGWASFSFRFPCKRYLGRQRFLVRPPARLGGTYTLVRHHACSALGVMVSESRKNGRRLGWKLYADISTRSLSVKIRPALTRRSEGLLEYVLLLATQEGREEADVQEMPLPGSGEGGFGHAFLGCPGVGVVALVWCSKQGGSGLFC